MSKVLTSNDFLEKKYAEHLSFGSDTHVIGRYKGVLCSVGRVILECAVLSRLVTSVQCVFSRLFSRCVLWHECVF